jgi:chaperonin cofactor prefoldin
VRPFYPKAEEHIEGEVRPATLPEILDLVDTKSAGIQDTLTSECLGHLTLALSMLHKQQTSDREQLEDLRSRFNKEAEVGTDDKVRLLTDTDGDGVYDQYTDAADIDPLTCDPVNGHLAGGMTAEEIITHERLHAGFQQERMQKLQNENTELERQIADKDREIVQLKNRLEQIRRVTEGGQI